MSLRTRLDALEKATGGARGPDYWKVWYTDCNGLVLDDGRESTRRWVGRPLAEVTDHVNESRMGIAPLVVVGDRPYDADALRYLQEGRP
jgi:hypothetical protein